MTAHKHTPGPWFIERRTNDGGTTHHSITASDGHGWSGDRYMSVSGCIDSNDAHLIAAAPEMYAALVAAEARLRSLEKTIDSEFGDCRSEDEMEAAKAWSPEVYTARAAIAKATGENT